MSFNCVFAKELVTTQYAVSLYMKANKKSHEWLSN